MQTAPGGSRPDNSSPLARLGHLRGRVAVWVWALVVATVLAPVTAVRSQPEPTPTPARGGPLTRAAAASAQAGVASLVFDPSDGRILHAVAPDVLHYPASLTKLMTLYLAFEAIQADRITLDRALPVSAHAARQPPTKLGLRAGQAISARDAIRAIAVVSSNDAAVVLAEALAKSESRFVAEMNRTARDLGLEHTRFRNASGLPGAGQHTSARDIARLSMALYARFAELSQVFAARGMRFEGETLPTHNAALGRVAGGDGVKTGFTCEAGYNIVLSAVRGPERRMSVVLGALNRRARNRTAIRLLEASFAGPQQAAGYLGERGQRATAAPAVRLPAGQCHRSGTSRTARVASSARQLRGWALFLGNYVTRKEAEQVISRALATLGRAAKAGTIARPRRVQRGLLARGEPPRRTWKAVLGGWEMAAAGPACKALRASGQHCSAHSPAVVRALGYAKR